MGSTGGREGVPVLINKAPLSGSREGGAGAGTTFNGGVGASPNF